MTVEDVALVLAEKLPRVRLHCVDKPLPATWRKSHVYLWEIDDVIWMGRKRRNGQLREGVVWDPHATEKAVDMKPKETSP